MAGWVAKGTWFNYILAPLDPAGRTVAFSGQILVWDPVWAPLFAVTGGQALGQYVGQLEMINKSTGKYTLVANVFTQTSPRRSRDHRPKRGMAVHRPG